MKKLLSKNLIFVVINIFSFAAMATTIDQNVPLEIQRQLAVDLKFVKKIKSYCSSPLHRQVFGHVNGDTYMNYFEDHVSAIGLDNCGSGATVACIYPNLDSKKMWLSPKFTEFSHPQIARVLILFHEAKHAQSAKDPLPINLWPHALCPNPFINALNKNVVSIWSGSVLSGTLSCDNTAVGSFGSSLIMLKNIQKFCTNCNSKVKMDAGLYADDQLTRIIDEAAKLEIRNDLYKK
jgi:hypothetical protein